MGLDLMLMKKADFDNENWGDELAYGRKTWDIACWFMDRSNVIEKECLYEVPEEIWDEFYVKSYVFRDNVEILLKACDIDDDNFCLAAYDQLQKTLERLFDSCYFSLGVDWEARALLRWIEANDKIKDAYKEGPVYLVASW